MATIADHPVREVAAWVRRRAARASGRLSSGAPGFGKPFGGGVPVARGPEAAPAEAVPEAAPEELAERVAEPGGKEPGADADVELPLFPTAGAPLWPEPGEGGASGLASEPVVLGAITGAAAGPAAPGATTPGVTVPGATPFSAFSGGLGGTLGRRSARMSTARV